MILSVNLKNLVREQGKLEVQEHLKEKFVIDCSSEIPGFSKTVDVHDIFTPNNLVSKKKFFNHSGTLTVQDILNVKSSNGEIASVIVVEGLAGAGKTTLAKVILSHWCKETDFIRNLKQYDLILFSEFRIPACTDIKELFLMHMPKTFKKMTGESLVMAIMNLKILVIMDGFEEMNSYSQTLLIHFIQRLNSHKMQLLITTRPNRDEALFKIIPKNIEICHLEIVGVPQDRLSEFVLKWHNIMKSKGSKGNEVSNLLEGKTVKMMTRKRFLDTKVFGEFYGALALCDLLKRGSDDEILQRLMTDFHEILISNQLPIGVTKRIRGEVKKTLKRSLNKTNTVLEILQDLHYDKPDSFSLLRYQKVLIHLIGVLKLESSLSEEYASELVDLLKETNLTDTEAWLNILTETDCEVNIVPKVREIISGNTNYLYVRDGHLKAAACVLQNSEFEYVNIDTFSDPGKLGYLKDVLKSLSSRKTFIHLSLLHHWHYPEQGWSDDFLHCLLNKNKVKLTHFKGSVKSLSSLSKQTEGVVFGSWNSIF
ncbi:uncharacterized protein LOC135224055 [Macrobrachium nipponense]|uniref:uncharacterized protein LOC135224055 n=1 Tax=Macrobrachium nipponense TaxID=159736 RepID=UPI0030C8815E